MHVWTSLVLCCVVKGCFSIKYENVSLLEPAVRQLYDFKQEHKKPIGVLTTTAGEPIDVRDIFAMNSDQFSNPFHTDLHMSFIGERVPERIVHSKGMGAEGYFEVTNDVTQYTSADLFSEIGKRTPVFTRFSTSVPGRGNTDLLKEFKGMAVKFYTKEGNLDFLCLQTPVYLYKDPINFPSIVHSFQTNPRTNVLDNTMRWDYVTLRPENLHTFLWLLSDYGLPNGYRRMDAFPIHTYEIFNKKGEKHYVKFNFRTEQGLDNLTLAQARVIQGRDLDYYIRDLYNAIERKQYPSWRLEMDVMTPEEIKNVDFDPFDVTKLWENGTYTTVQIGRVVYDKIPDNHFRSVEQSAFNPANLVPGIPGPVDHVFKSRRIVYRETQNHRVGTNHNKASVNLPRYAKTYVRDGVPPINNNMEDVPNYFPNSFSGPVPYVDDKRPDEVLSVLHSNAIDLQYAADFYNKVLTNDGQRQRLAETLVISLVTVTPPVRKRTTKFLYLVDYDLGKRVETGLKAALIAASANQQ